MNNKLSKLSSLQVEDHPAGATIPVWVQPRASRNEIVGIREGALHIRVTAPPVDGRANDTVGRLIAAAVKVPPSSVECLSGHRGRRKRLLVHGLNAAAIRSLLTATGAVAGP